MARFSWVWISFRRLRSLQGVVGRGSFASERHVGPPPYLTLALANAAAATVLEMGNSADNLMSYYRELTTPFVAQNFLAVGLISLRDRFDVLNQDRQL